MTKQQEVYTFEEGVELDARAKPIQYTINSETECWEVCGREPRLDGYYQVNRNGKAVYLHRYVYELTKGAIPEGLIVRHLCNNPRCINPLHLETGTQADNMQDKVKSGRQAKGKDLPHSKLTAEQVREIFLSVEPKDVLAERYGVCRQTIGQIQSGKRWAHVTADLTPPRRPKRQIRLKRQVRLKKQVRSNPKKEDEATVRITALSKKLRTAKRFAETMIQSGVISFKTPEEIEAFRKGVQITLALIRGEYGIKAE